MAKPDEMAVPERQLTQPPKTPQAVSVSAVLKNNVTCEKHGNPMASARLDFRAKPGTSGVAVFGEVKLQFIGCACAYWRPLK